MKLRSLEEIKLSALEENIGSILVSIDLENKIIQDLEKENITTPNKKTEEVINRKKQNIKGLDEILRFLMLRRDNLYLQLNPQNKIE